MRLIDADKLTKDRGGNDPIRIAVMREPTAYDMNKIVEQIREYADNVAELGANFLPKVVIEIIKGGGLDDGK